VFTFAQSRDCFLLFLKTQQTRLQVTRLAKIQRPNNFRTEAGGSHATFFPRSNIFLLKIYNIFHPYFQSHQKLQLSEGFSVAVKILSLGHVNHRIAKGNILMHHPEVPDHAGYISNPEKLKEKWLFYVPSGYNQNPIAFKHRCQLRRQKRTGL
jgi:hypothetical protein